MNTALEASGHDMHDDMGKFAVEHHDAGVAPFAGLTYQGRLVEPCRPDDPGATVDEWDDQSNSADAEVLEMIWGAVKWACFLIGASFVAVQAGLMVGGWLLKFST